MRFKINHGLKVGQIFRDGKHFRECVFACGPLYDSVPYKVNQHWFPPRPCPQEDQLLIEMLNNSIRKDELFRR